MTACSPVGAPVSGGGQAPGFHKPGSSGPGFHRWVTQEPDIPFDLPVLYEDSRIIVVDKPHFLPTTPRGMWYRSTALIRLREKYGDEAITPVHRLDRMTAGIVVFVRDPRYRRDYQLLFQNRQARKKYVCLAPAKPVVRPALGTLFPLIDDQSGLRLSCPDDRRLFFPLIRSSHITKTRGVLQACEEADKPNAVTIIRLSADQPRGQTLEKGLRSYDLFPRTGKTHQLRVHMNSLGLPIVGDPLYPEILPEAAYDDFSDPLRLVAQELDFADPVSGQDFHFRSRWTVTDPVPAERSS